MKAGFDIAVIGSGFAGSLLAMCARRSGRSVALLERGTHPRFAIGESSTPLANLILEQLAQRYGLKGVSPLSKWGSWQRECPQVGCGLKRGFTFYHHELGKPWQQDRQLLVGASPRDAIADTHWYRQDLDAYLVGEAQRAGVTYLDHARLEDIQRGDSLTLRGQRGTTSFTLRARLVVDASGPRGCLYHHFKLPAAPLPNLPVTRAVYAHFHDVHRWEQLFPSKGTLPYPPDDAAVHHVFPGGWAWVLRFGNGLTSAGVAATNSFFTETEASSAAALWQHLLDRLPSVRDQFRDARPAFPFVFQREVAFRAGQIAGPGWVLLPSAAGFIDPLLSTGFPLTLLGVERLARLISDHWGEPAFEKGLASYRDQTERELLAAELLIAALYAAMEDPQLFNAVTLLYFAAASYAETTRRLGRPERAGPSFLCADHGVFGPRMKRCLQSVLGAREVQKRAGIIEDIYAAIEPIDVAGLGARAGQTRYPVRLQDLLESADKLGSNPAEIQRVLGALY